jgi:hypothetical protein
MSFSKPNYTGMLTRNMRTHLLRDMPRDWLIQVMDCLPTKCLFQLMRTCKQWEAVSRYIIKYRKVLILEWPEDKENMSLFVVGYGRDGDRVYQHTETMEKMLNSLKQMVNLQKLHVSDEFHITCEVLVDELITSNAGSLRDVKVDQMPHDETLVYPFLKKHFCEIFDASNAGRVFPKMEDLTIRTELVFDGEKSAMPHLKHLCIYDERWFVFEVGDDEPDDVLNDSPFVMAHSASLVLLQCFKLRSDRPVVFPKLKKLIIVKLPENVTFPVMDDLRVYSAAKPESFSHLPVLNMKKLKVRTDSDATRADEIEVCKSISQMMNLTELKLELRFGCKSGAEFPDLLSAMHQLVSVSIQTIALKSGQKCLIQKWLLPLLQNNAGLQSLELRGIPLHNEDLVLCSQLNLQHLHAYSERFTVTGVLTFLRGSSRNVIRELHRVVSPTKKGSILVEQLDQEMTAIAKERGITFERTRVTKAAGFMPYIKFQSAA